MAQTAHMAPQRPGHQPKPRQQPERARWNNRPGSLLPQVVTAQKPHEQLALLIGIGREISRDSIRRKPGT